MRKKETAVVSKVARAESEDSFDRGENDLKSRDCMTSTIVKSEQSGSYYLITLHYTVLGDKYHFSLKDLAKRSQICTKQEIPTEFALY